MRAGCALVSAMETASAMDAVGRVHGRHVVAGDRELRRGRRACLEGDEDAQESQVQGIWLVGALVAVRCAGLAGRQLRLAWHQAFWVDRTYQAS